MPVPVSGVTGRTRVGRRRRAGVPRARLASVGLLLTGVLLGGCYGYPATRESARDYHLGYTQRSYTLAFVPGQADPAPQDAAALAGVRRTLRADASAVLVAEGPLAQDRASRVSRALARPVSVDARAASRQGRDEAVLVLLQPAIVPDACTGAGQPVGRNLWTFDDYTRQRLLPPGCATAAMLLEQAADRRDVLRGRVLEPGAAGPIARAADIYLRRNADRPVTGGESPGPGEASEGRDPGPAQAASAGAGSGALPAPALQAPQSQVPQSQGPTQQERLPPASTPLTPR